MNLGYKSQKDSCLLTVTGNKLGDKNRTVHGLVEPSKAGVPKLRPTEAIYPAHCGLGLPGPLVWHHSPDHCGRALPAQASHGIGRGGGAATPCPMPSSRIAQWVAPGNLCRRAEAPRACTWARACLPAGGLCSLPLSPAGRAPHPGWSVKVASGQAAAWWGWREGAKAASRKTCSSPSACLWGSKGPLAEAAGCHPPGDPGCLPGTRGRFCRLPQRRFLALPPSLPRFSHLACLQGAMSTRWLP